MEQLAKVITDERTDSNMNCAVIIISSPARMSLNASLLACGVSDI
jgi:hypothetical protein